MSIASFLRKIRKQKAVYWEVSGPDGYGNYTYEDPVEIDCRWEDISEKYVARGGDEKISRSVVYVDRSMKEGSYLKKGELDSATLDSPIDDADAFQIMRFSDVPDIKNQANLYQAYL